MSCLWSSLEQFLDEAFLDVSDSRLFNGSASLLSAQIRKQIEQEIGITASAGIASNKFLAKVASDWQKPNGQFVIRPQDVTHFMQQLPVKKIPGVGKKSMIKMQRLGIQTCGELQRCDETILHQHFGVFGSRLKQLSFGVDNRPVTASRLRKSLSVEHTFSENISHCADCNQPLSTLYAELLQRLELFYQKLKNQQHTPLPVIKSLHLKLKFYDFSI